MNETDIYREWAPPPAWRHAVACLWEQRVTRPRVQRVLPDGNADLLFHQSGAVEIVGVADSVDLPLLAAGTVIRGVRLRPEVVGRALRTPAASLRNLTVPAADVVGERQSRRLADPQYLDSWLGSIQPDPLTTAAVRLLAEHRVGDVAETLSLSPRHLRRLLLAETGLGPKGMAQVARLQRFVRAADDGVPLATASAGAGYADQAHLSREVKRYSGLTPAQLVRQRRSVPGVNATD